MSYNKLNLYGALIVKEKELKVDSKVNFQNKGKLSEALKYAHIARRSHTKIEISRNKVEVPEGASRMFSWS